MINHLLHNAAEALKQGNPQVARDTLKNVLTFMSVLEDARGRIFVQNAIRHLDLKFKLRK